MARDDDLRLDDGVVFLRSLREDDVGPRYLGWLQDPAVLRWLELRFAPQSLASIADFVRAVRSDPASWALAICDGADGSHIGNLKVGPVNRHHGCADISYFIGERSRWGRGLASRAIRLATGWAFSQGIFRLQAGLYAGNTGSARALEKAGYTYECAWQRQLVDDGQRVDHLWYAAWADTWSMTP
jgi:RimJ/RimL family protein N-acetyltransferase